MPSQYTAVCHYCGKSFTPKRNTKGYFCSQQCCNAYKRDRGNVRVDNGYRFVYMPEHPRAKSNGYVREHLLVVEEMLGRPLAPNEVIHHIDGNRGNNSPSNLEVLSSQSEHFSLHMREYHKSNPEFRHLSPEQKHKRSANLEE